MEQEPVKRPPRRWRIPPAVLRDYSEPFDGWRIFQEVRNDVGVALWHMVRDVELWATTPEREGLFSPGAAGRRRELLRAAKPPPPLAPALDVLAGLVAYPVEASADAVSLACERVARWAEARQAHSTALAFAQAAALALPESSRAAVEVGRLAAIAGDKPRAESWFRRAVALARREENRSTYALAWVELGDLYAGTGLERRARWAYTRAFRMARRTSVYTVRGRALWGVARLEMRAGRYAEAERALWKARRAFLEGDSLHAAFTHDRAEVAVWQGRGAEAAPMLRRLLIGREDPVDRLRTLALLALCAAQAGDTAAVGELWHQAEPMTHAAPPGEGVAVALLDLARAALDVGHRRFADASAGRAAEMARQHGPARVVEHADALVDAASAPPQSAAS
jgi:tetratricopeptide (TPR) repeat protein